MDDIVLTRVLRQQSLDAREIRRMHRVGDLFPVRRGAYARSQQPDRSIEAMHRELISATVPQLREGAVLSHGSAAGLHGLPIWAGAVERVHVTRDRVGGGNRRSIVQIHGAPLAGRDRGVIDGIPVTSLPRTVLDLCRTLPIEQAVAAGDRALAHGLAMEVLEKELSWMLRWPGTSQADAQSRFSMPGVRAPENRSAGSGCIKTVCPLRISKWMSSSRPDGLLRAWTSAGTSSERSGSSTAR